MYMYGALHLLKNRAEFELKFRDIKKDKKHKFKRMRARYLIGYYFFKKMF